jgi:hypothetical protein
MQYQGLLSVRRLTALHSGFLQTTLHDNALAFGWYFRYHHYMMERGSYTEDFNLLSSRPCRAYTSASSRQMNAAADPRRL